MPEATMDDLRYPTGRFTPKGAPLTPQERTEYVERIAALPGELREAVAGLSEEQLGTPYRDGGWSPREITHHVADSHVNAYVRFKLGLTEDVPTIKPYEQEGWASLADTRETPVEVSLTLLEALHVRWSVLLHSLSEDDFGRRLGHPEMGEIDLDLLLSLYAWHGHHHATQIVALRQRKGW